MPYDASVPDPMMHDILTDIEKWELSLVENQDFVEADVYLDRREFRNCTFRNCRIFLKVGHFRVTGKIVFAENHIICSGPAEGVRSLVERLSHDTR